MTDIDIDLPDRDSALALFRHTGASNHQSKNDKHHTGTYFHKVPVNPVTGRCTIDFREAEELGLFKIDVINVSLYNDIKDRAHLKRLIAKEPDWSKLESITYCQGLFQLRVNSSICQVMKPRSIEQLAAVIAIIRPGKRYLHGQSWDYVMSEVWQPNKDGAYSFKKSHSIAYATVIVAQMNLIEEQENEKS